MPVRLRALWARLLRLLRRPRPFLVRCIGEARPTVQLIFLLRFVAGWSFSGAAIGPRFLTGALVWELAVLSVYLFNGVMDVVDELYITG